MKHKVNIEESSGNIFLDLGFPPEEAAVLLMRAEIMVALRRLIKGRKWTQAQAAKVLGVTQPRISDLFRGKYDRFSLEMLIQLATKAGIQVELKMAA